MSTHFTFKFWNNLQENSSKDTHVGSVYILHLTNQ
jgi:hypothetical protein